MAQSWLLLIYTVPAKPTRKRAFIWREIKKAGAIYLRDGVCALPPGEATFEAFRAIAAKVQELEGQAVVAQQCELPPERSAALIDQMVEARAREYVDLIRQATLLTRHMEREGEHRTVQRTEFEGDLGKLHHWLDQIRSRDYFAPSQMATAEQVLDQCEMRLMRLLTSTESVSP